MEKILYHSISKTRKRELSDCTNYMPRHFFFRLSQFSSTVCRLKMNRFRTFSAQSLNPNRIAEVFPQCHQIYMTLAFQVFMKSLYIIVVENPRTVQKVRLKGKLPVMGFNLFVNKWTRLAGFLEGGEEIF